MHNLINTFKSKNKDGVNNAEDIDLNQSENDILFSSDDENADNPYFMGMQSTKHNPSVMENHMINLANIGINKRKQSVMQQDSGISKQQAQKMMNFFNEKTKTLMKSRKTLNASQDSNGYGMGDSDSQSNLTISEKEDKEFNLNEFFQGKGLSEVSEYLNDSGNIVSGQEDANMCRNIFEQIMLVEKTMCLLVAFAFCLSAIDVSKNYNDQASDGQKLHYQSLQMIITVILIIMTILRNKIQFEMKKWKKRISMQENFFKKQYLTMMLLEIIIVIPCPNILTQNLKYEFIPRFDMINAQTSISVDTAFYRWNEILSVIMCLRVFIIYRFFIIRSYFQSNRASRVDQMYSFESNYLYSIRSMFTDTPIFVISVCIILGLIIFSCGLCVGEGPLYRNPYQMDDQLNIIQNAVWYVWITMATVGYGDYTVYTDFGRAICFICSTYGVLMISLVVLTFCFQVQFNPLQAQCMNLLIRLRLRERMRNCSATAISTLIRFFVTGHRIQRELKGMNIAEKDEDAFLKTKGLAYPTENVGNIIKEELVKFKQAVSLYKVMKESNTNDNDTIANNFYDAKETIKDIEESAKYWHEKIQDKIEQLARKYEEIDMKRSGVDPHAKNKNMSRSNFLSAKYMTMQNTLNEHASQYQNVLLDSDLVQIQKNN